jgi:cystine transport system substrate-binding protein
MKKTKILAVAGLALLATVTLAACGASSSKSDSAADKKVLKVGTEGTYAPFSYHNDKDQLVGYDVEVAKAVGKKIGYTVKFEESPWDSMLAAFDANQTDVVFNQATINDERKEKYLVSEPYSVSHVALITTKDNTEIKDFSDIKGKKAAQSTSSNFGIMAEKEGATLVTADGFSKAAELVINGQADVTLNDDVSFYDYLKQKPKANLKIQTVSDDTSEVAALLHKKDTKLLKKINTAIKELHDDGTLTKLSEKYFDKDISK